MDSREEWFGLGELSGNAARQIHASAAESADSYVRSRSSVRAHGGYVDIGECRAQRLPAQRERAGASNARTARMASAEAVQSFPADVREGRSLDRLERMVGEVLATVRVLDGSLKKADGFSSTLDAVARNVEGLAHAGSAVSDGDRKLDELLAAARALGESMTAHAADSGERATAIDALLAGVRSLSERFDARIAKSDYEDEVLKSMSAEVQQHRDGLYRKIVEPLVSEVIDVHEDMGATVARYRREAEGGSAGSESGALRDLEEFRLMLGDILRNWGVEMWKPEPGDALEPRRCRVMRAVPTDDEARHRTVAEAITAGYAFDGRILRPAQVAAYSFSPVIEAPSEAAGAEEGGEGAATPEAAPAEAVDQAAKPDVPAMPLAPPAPPVPPAPSIAGSPGTQHAPRASDPLGASLLP